MTSPLMGDPVLTHNNVSFDSLEKALVPECYKKYGPSNWYGVVAHRLKGKVPLFRRASFYKDLYDQIFEAYEPEKERKRCLKKGK